MHRIKCFCMWAAYLVARAHFWFEVTKQQWFLQINAVTWTGAVWYFKAFSCCFSVTYQKCLRKLEVFICNDCIVAFNRSSISSLIKMSEFCWPDAFCTGQQSYNVSKLGLPSCNPLGLSAFLICGAIDFLAYFLFFLEGRSDNDWVLRPIRIQYRAVRKSMQNMSCYFICRPILILWQSSGDIYQTCFFAFLLQTFIFSLGLNS